MFLSLWGAREGVRMGYADGIVLFLSDCFYAYWQNRIIYLEQTSVHLF